jgi:2Fe-2S ferredoxin
VIVDPADFASLAPMEPMEDEMLYGTAVDREETSRLCCQIKVTEDFDLHVTTPETQV